MDQRLPARLALAALALLAACATPPDLPMVTGEGWENSSRFRKLLVLPFTDGRGEGKRLAASAASELGRSGYDIVEQHQAKLVLDELKLEEGGELSLHTLADIRKATFADAVVVGSWSSDGKYVTAMAIETLEGDVVASVRARAPYGSVYESYDAAGRAAAKALASVGRRQGAPLKLPSLTGDDD